MKRSVETSQFLELRAAKVVPKRVEEMVGAIERRDFEAFARVTMQDSNQFHSVCLDTYPPCFYMNDVSRAVVELVHLYNEYRGATKVAYTFDAGPNACLYLLEDDVDEVVTLVNDIFPSVSDPREYFRGLPLNLKNSGNLQEALKLKPNSPGLLKYIIHTKIGDGPKILTTPSEHLLTENGLPKNL
jgi:diphosphomevalonate decarboxylase